MPKFYVQSGSLRAVIHSADQRRAALWVIQRAMDPILPEEHEEVLVGSAGECNPPMANAPNDFVALGPAILLSELGFDREDATQFDTLEMFSQWHDLVRAIDQIACLV
ncbi:MAG: hypothetical protein FJ308_17665 [Planctomycetes bacterium]|nr:hypothetical protein [Planctomycetota bacterium]